MLRKILIFLSLSGLADSVYLSPPYLTKSVQTSCSINNANSCEVVTTSEYAKTFFDIPNAFLGIFFYTFLFLIFIFWNKIGAKIKLFSLLILSFGTGFYIYLIYVQKIILNQYCLFCLASAGITFLLFILNFVLWKKEKNNLN